MSLTENINHVEEAIGYLLEQFKDQPNIAAFLTAFVEQLQIIEATAWDLYLGRSLDTAIGSQLDVLGRIVGRARTGEDDDTYRLYLRAQILINRSSGTAPEIIAIVELITNQLLGNNGIHTQDWPPAKFGVYVPYLNGADPAVLLALIKLAKAAGVGTFLEYGTAVPPGEFNLIFDGTVDEGFDSGLSVT